MYLCVCVCVCTKIEHPHTWLTNNVVCCHLLVDVTEFATTLSGWDKLATKCLVVLDFILNIGTWRKFVCGELFEKISTILETYCCCSY